MSTPHPINAFSNMPRDASRQVIQVSNGIVTQDGTASPQTSPFMYTTGVTTLVVPANAVELVLAPSTALNLSEIVGMSRYFIIGANTIQAIGCAGMGNVYIAANTTGGTLSFYFVTV